MDTFNEIIKLVGTNLIKGMFMSVLVIIFCRKIFKKEFDTQNAIGIIRWVMIFYSILIFVHFLLLVLLPPSSKIFFLSIQERATGPYSFAFWLMALGSISPFILFFKKLSNKTYLILVLTIFMNFGWLMELLIIHTANIERDYSPKVGGFKEFEGELAIAIQGIIFGVLSMLIGNLPFFRKNTVD
jgi:hypothetical protein